MKKILKYTLNVILAIILSIPVITLMDAITAMHFVNFKLHDNADINVPKEFFKSFKDNIGQSLILTIILGGIGAYITYSWVTALSDFDNMSKGTTVILLVASFLFCMIESFSTYLLAKFENTLGRFIILVLSTIGACIDVAVKMAVFEMAIIAITAFIVLVNPGVILLTVAVIFAFISVVIYEFVSAKWIQSVYGMLLASKEKKEQKETETLEETELSAEETSEESAEEKHSENEEE